MNPTARSFQRKITGFCEIRLATLVSPAELKRLTAYMLALVNDQALPPMKGKTVDWAEVAAACRLSAKPSTKLMRVGQHGFDAIIRWVNTNTATPRDRTSSSSASARISKARAAGSSRPAKKNSKPGAKPKPIEEFPVALFDKYTEPVSFQAALEFHIRRFGPQYASYHIVGEHHLKVRLDHREMKNGSDSRGNQYNCLRARRVQFRAPDQPRPWLANSARGTMLPQPASPSSDPRRAAHIVWRIPFQLPFAMDQAISSKYHRLTSAKEISVGREKAQTRTELTTHSFHSAGMRQMFLPFDLEGGSRLTDTTGQWPTIPDERPQAQGLPVWAI